MIRSRSASESVPPRLTSREARSTGERMRTNNHDKSIAGTGTNDRDLNEGRKAAPGGASPPPTRIRCTTSAIVLSKKTAALTVIATSRNTLRRQMDIVLNRFV